MEPLPYGVCQHTQIPQFAALKKQYAFRLIDPLTITHFNGNGFQIIVQVLVFKKKCELFFGVHTSISLTAKIAKKPMTSKSWNCHIGLVAELLHLNQSFVKAVIREQFLVVARFYNTARFEYHDLIGILDGAEPVGDHQRGT